MAKKEPRSELQKEINRVELYLQDLEPDSEAYMKAAANLKVLYETKKAKKDALWVPKPEAVINAVVSIVEVFCILNYEELHVVTTKAFQFLLKNPLNAK